MAGAMVAAVIASASRAGSVLALLESAAVLLIAWWLGVKSARKVSAVFAGLLVVCSLGFTAVVGGARLWARLQDPDPYNGRRELLISAAAMTRAKPWTGFGLGTYEIVYPGFSLFDVGDLVDHAHNDWAEFACDGGVPFLLLLFRICDGRLATVSS